MRKQTMWIPTRSDTNEAVQLQKMARGLKFRIQKVEGLHYLCSENKGADQLRGYREVDLRLFFSHMQNVSFLMTRLICHAFCRFKNPFSSVSDLNHVEIVCVC